MQHIGDDITNFWNYAWVSDENKNIKLYFDIDRCYYAVSANQSTELCTSNAVKIMSESNCYFYPWREWAMTHAQPWHGHCDLNTCKRLQPLLCVGSIHHKTCKLTSLCSGWLTFDERSTFLPSLFLFFEKQIIFLIAMLDCLRKLGKFHSSRFDFDTKAFKTQISNYCLRFAHWKQMFSSNQTQLVGTQISSGASKATREKPTTLSTFGLLNHGLWPICEAQAVLRLFQFH